MGYNWEFGDMRIRNSTLKPQSWSLWLNGHQGACCFNELLLDHEKNGRCHHTLYYFGVHALVEACQALKANHLCNCIQCAWIKKECEFIIFLVIIPNSLELAAATFWEVPSDLFVSKMRENEMKETHTCVL
jgi:hypothetical protein